MKALTFTAGALLGALVFVAPTLPPERTHYYADLAPADCTTDEECAFFCPPPADDPDCDGGPQDAHHGRGDYGSQP